MISCLFPTEICNKTMLKISTATYSPNIKTLMCQIVQVHQESVDMYLEDMILRNVDYLAEQQAREDIHKKAQQLNDIAYAMEER